MSDITVTITDKRPVQYEDTQTTYTEKELREIFDENTIVIQLLKIITALRSRVEELERENKNLNGRLASNIGGVLDSYRNGERAAYERCIEIVRDEPIEYTEWDDAITYQERKIIAAIRTEMAKGGKE